MATPLSLTFPHIAAEGENEADRNACLITDAELFRSMVGGVTPLPAQNNIEPAQPSTQARVRSPAPIPTLADTLSNPFDEAPEDYLGNGLSRLGLRKLRHMPLQDSLDLHGNTIDSARKLLQEFLHHARIEQMRCIEIIHGKGINSRDGEAVLRNHTRHWLRQHPQVLAYCTASGSGAVRVILKSE